VPPSARFALGGFWPTAGTGYVKTSEASPALLTLARPPTAVECFSADALNLVKTAALLSQPSRTAIEEVWHPNHATASGSCGVGEPGSESRAEHLVNSPSIPQRRDKGPASPLVAQASAVGTVIDR
jgi:hypothetical protein